MPMLRKSIRKAWKSLRQLRLETAVAVNGLYWRTRLRIKGLFSRLNMDSYAANSLATVTEEDETIEAGAARPAVKMKKSPFVAIPIEGIEMIGGDAPAALEGRPAKHEGDTLSASKNGTKTYKNTVKEEPENETRETNGPMDDAQEPEEESDDEFYDSSSSRSYSVDGSDSDAYETTSEGESEEADGDRRFDFRAEEEEKENPKPKPKIGTTPGAPSNPFDLLDEYNRVEPKDRPTPIDLEAGVFWYVIPSPEKCGPVWRLAPHKAKLGRLRLLHRALELTEGPFKKDDEDQEPLEEPKVKKLVDLYRAFSIHVRVRHPIMGEGNCLALVYIGETVLLKPETKCDSDVDYWHRLMMSIKVQEFPDIYGRPVTRYDFMEVAWAVAIVKRPTIWDSAEPFSVSNDLYRAHRFFEGPKWLAVYDSVLYICDQDVIPQKCNPPYRPDNCVEIPWKSVYQIGAEQTYFYIRMAANGPWGLGTIYMKMESWDAAKAVNAQFRKYNESKDVMVKIRVVDEDEIEDARKTESKSWFFSLSGWQSKNRRDRIRHEPKKIAPLAENKRVELFDRIITKTQRDLEIEMEQAQAPPIREVILEAMRLRETHPPMPYPEYMEEAMAPKSFFPGAPDEREVPEVDEGEEEEGEEEEGEEEDDDIDPDMPSSSRGRRRRKRHAKEKIRFFHGADYVHMENDGTMLTDEQPCLHAMLGIHEKTKAEEERESQLARARIDEALATTAFKAPPDEAEQKLIHGRNGKGRRRAKTSHSFFNRRWTGILHRAHTIKSKMLGQQQQQPRLPRNDLEKLGTMTDAELFNWPVLERRIRQDSFGDTDSDLFPKTVYGQSYLKKIHEQERTYPEQEEDVQWDFTADKPKPFHKFTYALAAALQLDAVTKAALKREGPRIRPEFEEYLKKHGAKKETDEEAKKLSEPEQPKKAEIAQPEDTGSVASESEDDYVVCDHGDGASKSVQEKPKLKSDERKSLEAPPSNESTESAPAPQARLKGRKTREDLEKIPDKVERRAALKEWRANELRAILPAKITDDQIRDIVRAEFVAEDAAVNAREMARKASQTLASAKKADMEAKTVKEMADRCDIEACKAQADSADASSKASSATARLAELHAAYGVPVLPPPQSETSQEMKKSSVRHRHHHHHHRHHTHTSQRKSSPEV